MLRKWVDWVDAGAPHLQPFSRMHGLCHALGIRGIFCLTYPFGGVLAFHRQVGTSTMHIDPARVAFARYYAAEKGK